MAGTCLLQSLWLRAVLWHGPFRWKKREKGAGRKEEAAGPRYLAQSHVARFPLGVWPVRFLPAAEL